MKLKLVSSSSNVYIAAQCKNNRPPKFQSGAYKSRKMVNDVETIFFFNPYSKGKYVVFSSNGNWFYVKGEKFWYEKAFTATIISVSKPSLPRQIVPHRAILSGNYVRSTAGKENSEIAKALKETNDCTVRSIVLLLDYDYDKAHRIMRDEFGRIPRKGTFFQAQITEKRSINGHQLTPYPPFGKTVGRFLSTRPQGKFLIFVKGHVSVIKDGVLYDGYYTPKLRSKLMAVFKLAEN
jgi:hypothetical protein